MATFANMSAMCMEMPVQGFFLYRDVVPGESYDPTCPPKFFPEQGSDELFDALRAAYPNAKTHSERTRNAVIDFLLKEQREEQARNQFQAPTGPAQSYESAQTSPWPSWPSVSSSSTFSSPDLIDLATPASVNSPNGSQMTRQLSQSTQSLGTTSSTPSLDQMTGVFSLSSQPQPKTRVRRKMTEAEKIEYRKRRIVKACESCSKRKRKCHHNQVDLQDTKVKVTKKRSPSTTSSTPAARSFEKARQPAPTFMDSLTAEFLTDESLFSLSMDSQPQRAVDDNLSALLDFDFSAQPTQRSTFPWSESPDWTLMDMPYEHSAHQQQSFTDQPLFDTPLSHDQEAPLAMDAFGPSTSAVRATHTWHVHEPQIHQSRLSPDHMGVKAPATAIASHGLQRQLVQDDLVSSMNATGGSGSPLYACPTSDIASLYRADLDHRPVIARDRGSESLAALDQAAMPTGNDRVLHDRANQHTRTVAVQAGASEHRKTTTSALLSPAASNHEGVVYGGSVQAQSNTLASRERGAGLLAASSVAQDELRALLDTNAHQRYREHIEGSPQTVADDQNADVLSWAQTQPTHTWRIFPSFVRSAFLGMATHGGAQAGGSNSAAKMAASGLAAPSGPGTARVLGSSVEDKSITRLRKTSTTPDSPMLAQTGSVTPNLLRESSQGSTGDTWHLDTRSSLSGTQALPLVAAEHTGGQSKAATQASGLVKPAHVHGGMTGLTQKHSVEDQGLLAVSETARGHVDSEALDRRVPAYTSNSGIKRVQQTGTGRTNTLRSTSAASASAAAPAPQQATESGGTSTGSVPSHRTGHTQASVERVGAGGSMLRPHVSGRAATANAPWPHTTTTKGVTAASNVPVDAAVMSVASSSATAPSGVARPRTAVHTGPAMDAHSQGNNADNPHATSPTPLHVSAATAVQVQRLVDTMCADFLARSLSASQARTQTRLHRGGPAPQVLCNSAGGHVGVGSGLRVVAVA